MICPKCKSKLLCQDTRQLDNYNRYRYYACIQCNKVYQSEEKLDLIPTEKIVQKRLIKSTKKIIKENKNYNLLTDIYGKKYLQQIILGV